MREKVALVVSRKFNAGHYSHAVAFRSLLSEEGWRAYLYMHPLFRSMLSDPEDPVLTSFREVRTLKRVDLVVVLFPSVRALIDILLTRLIFGSRIVYIFHEPFESVAAYLKAGFGWRRTFRICLVSAVSYVIALCSHTIILSSRKAENAFRARYTSIRRRAGVVPLLFDDEAANRDLSANRKYIAYIGTIAADHAFDEFLKFMIHAANSGWFPELQFLIATGSALSSAQQRLIASMPVPDRVVLRQGGPLSNKEINDYYSQSVVVWNAYKRSMQSGVLAKCYMFGTPVLVSTSNASEYFVDHEHGVLVQNSYVHDEIRAAIAEILGHFAYYSVQCRARFLESFYYKQQARAFMTLVTP